MKVSVFLLMIGVLFFGNCSKKDDTFIRLSVLELPDSVTDVWGYVDTNTNKEYAIVGYGGFKLKGDENSGVVVVDVSNPREPEIVANVNTVAGFDVKVWQNYLYTIDGTGTGLNDGTILDISDPANPIIAGRFSTGHNMFIKDGYMYLQTGGQGLRIYNLNNNPTDPILVWSGGVDGHDSMVFNNRLYSFDAAKGTNIFDVSNPESPLLLGSVSDPFIRFHHSGWVTEDQNHLFICDELADSPPTPAPFDFTIWNISDLDNPVRVGGYADANATVHNLYIIGDFAYVSYYNAGLRIFDISEPASPRLVEEFSTSTQSGPGTDGAFGVYPFSPSGNIFLSDRNTGLHIFSFKKLEGSNPVAP